MENYSRNCYSSDIDIFMGILYDKNIEYPPERRDRHETALETSSIDLVY